MAKLSSHSLTLEIRYKNFLSGDVQYEIGFLWENQSIVNDTLLKRWSDYWSSRSNGYFLACEYERDTLIDTIEKALETDEPRSWEPYEPDIVLAIYPKKHFPFLIRRRYDFWEDDEEVKNKNEKTNGERAADDWFTVIAFVDAYNFQNCKAYCDSGIALHLLVERKDVEAFCGQLRDEYAEFRNKFKVDEYKPEYKVHKITK
jgi:hypothetical protein